MIGIIESILTGAVRSGTPILYGTLGEILTERAGIVNLGVEGSMVTGACVAFITTAETQDPVLGVIMGALAGGLASLIHAFMVVTLHANQIASGLALMFLCLGVTSFIGRPYVGVRITGIQPLTIPGLSDIPFLGRIMFEHDVLVYVAYLLAPLLWWFLFRTRWGLYIRAVGENKLVAFAMGMRVQVLQYGVIGIGGVFSGLGGAHLSLAYTQSWVEAITAGRGFVAVALTIFATWHPLRGVLGAVLFGTAFTLGLQIQAQGINVSPYYLHMLPYVLTLVGLLLWQKSRKHSMPEGLKSVFKGVG